MKHRLRNLLNRNAGASFEVTFSWEAVRADILAVRNGQTVKWLPGGRIVRQKSNLDWTLVRRGYPTLFADTKSVARSRFGRSMLVAHQLELVARYATHGAPAGFVVYLREVNAIVFYPASVFSPTRARAGYGVSDGTYLGRLQSFDLGRLWDPAR